MSLIRSTPMVWDPHPHNNLMQVDCTTRVVSVVSSHHSNTTKRFLVAFHNREECHSEHGDASYLKVPAERKTTTLNKYL